MAKRKPRTVLEHCVAKLGVHQGAFAAANVAQYAIATKDLGHVPTTDEYCEWWAVSERTGWYHRSRIRDVFGDDWPDVIEQVSHLIKTSSPRAAMSLPVTRPVAA
jgi:hypothetical protein